MQQLFHFIQKYRYFLFFLSLECIAVFFIINNNNFHKSKFISSANQITGALYSNYSKFTDYLHLKSHNKELILENITLKNQLEILAHRIDTISDFTVLDTLNFNQKYVYSIAKIINNNYHKANNYNTINKGNKQGVGAEMAVINSKGIIGIIDQASANYSRIQSILNTNSKINARLKNSFYFGTLIWNGKDYNTVQLIDIPRQAIINVARQAIINVGDTVITGGKSTIFPEGILIGSVKKIRDTSSLTQIIDVQLFNDMSNIGYVYVIKNLNKIEIKSVENLIDE